MASLPEADLRGWPRVESQRLMEHEDPADRDMFRYVEEEAQPAGKRDLGMEVGLFLKAFRWSTPRLVFFAKPMETNVFRLAAAKSEPFMWQISVTVMHSWGAR